MTMVGRCCFVAITLILAWLNPGAATARISASAGTMTCSVEQMRTLIGRNAEVSSVQVVSSTTSVREHCLVSGFFTGNGRTGFRVGLPVQWNGKFLFLGVGGLAGEPAPLEYGLARGYATASADTGHQSAWSNNGTWAAGRPRAKLDFLESAMHLAAQRLKETTVAFYRQPIGYAYFLGCSAGGRQGIVEAQRFPTTFDGVLAEEPAWHLSALLSQFIENAKIVRRYPDGWVSNQQFKAIDKLVVGQCDAADGLMDGIVSSVGRCRINLNALACKPGRRAGGCLNPHQVATLEQLQHPSYADASRGLFGTHLSGADSDDHGLGWPAYIFGTAPGGRWTFDGPESERSSWTGAPHQFVLGYEFLRNFDRDGAPTDWTGFSAAVEGAQWESRDGAVVDAKTDLSRFFRAGGKMLLWAGLSDPAIPPQMSIDLFNRIKIDSLPTRWDQPFDHSVRLFLAPGVQHCGPTGNYFGQGFTRFDALSALEQWVEHGRIPEQIDAQQVRGSTVIRSRPLCAYPKMARYDGKGDETKSGSFRCA